MIQGKILIIGATGYIGSQLLERLLSKGYSVRAAGRNLSKLNSFAWSKHPRLETFEVDVLNKENLIQACYGCEDVYYFVHSMNPQHKDFEKADRLAAQNMAEAAAVSGIKRIIYLGGLGEDERNLSKHLRSRMEVSRILHSGKVPVTTLRAAMIIGKGSVSFEILCSLVKRLPVMITPRWVSTQSQPIAVSNVLDYLEGCLGSEKTIGDTFDIGGPDMVTYCQLMDIYAQEAGIRKPMIIPVPVLTPRLSSLWIGLVTPYPAYIARPLAEGLKNKVVCRENRIRLIIPQKLLNCHDAIREALNKGPQ
jgi:uncharacterized protein YbjT (DUF2867 family)